MKKISDQDLKSYYKDVIKILVGIIKETKHNSISFDELENMVENEIEANSEIKKYFKKEKGYSLIQDQIKTMVDDLYYQLNYSGINVVSSKMKTYDYLWFENEELGDDFSAAGLMLAELGGDADDYSIYWGDKEGVFTRYLNDEEKDELEDYANIYKQEWKDKRSEKMGRASFRDAEIEGIINLLNNALKNGNFYYFYKAYERFIPLLQWYDLSEVKYLMDEVFDTSKVVDDDWDLLSEHRFSGVMNMVRDIISLLQEII